MALLFLTSAFVISTCGLVYELVNGALASYLLGDSVTQFSTVIGVYLFAMGIGSYLTKYVRGNLALTFVTIEILVGLVGGFSSGMLFVLFAHVIHFRVALYLIVCLTGMLVGAEIPLLLRILQNEFQFKDLVAKVFTFDYVGALLASILFPLLLVPHLGMIRTSFLFGILNVVVALAAIHILGAKSPAYKTLRGSAITALLILAAGFAASDRLEAYGEAGVFPGQTIFAKTTHYQRILITRQENDTRLFLNAHLQFSSRDEYRYHEALIHPGLTSVPNPERVLVLGGGDGMAVREILKHPDVKSVTLVDLDDEMTRIFSHVDFLRHLNEDAFLNARVRVINTDAFVWLKEHPGEKFDFIVLDFPDPANYSIGKLYTTTFFRLLREALNPDGRVVIQSTSPLAARKSYWCVSHTLAAAGFENVTPYHTYVPSFGEWGFVMGSAKPFRAADVYVPGLRYVDPITVADMLHFPSDMSEVATDVNRLNNQALVRYYEAEWSEFMVN
jgi:spermidine synthase